MPKYVMKVNHDRDLYVEWSTVVDNWCLAGTRPEMLDHLRSMEPRGYVAEPGHGPEDRLRRADENGTSALFPPSGPYRGAWDDKYLMVEQRGLLPRSALGEYLEAMFQDDEEAAYALVRPFDD